MANEVEMKLRAKILPWLASKHFRGISGLDSLRAAGVAILATSIFFFFWNTMLLWQVDSAYSTARLPEAEEADSAKEFVDALKREKVVDSREEIVDWFATQVGGDLERPASEQLLLLADSIASPPAEIKSKRDAQVRRLITGNLTGWRFFWLNGELSSGEQIIRAMEQSDDGRFTALLSQGNLPAQRRATLVKFADRTAVLVHGPIRNLRRFNGSIQWLTVALFMMVAVLSFQRFMLSRQIQLWIEDRAKNGGKSSQIKAPSIFAPSELMQRDPLLRLLNENKLKEVSGAERSPGPVILQLESDFQQGVHEHLGFLLGLIPSLGFIGTVLGMGEALMAADALFSESDRQVAVAQITQQLGFAFDTTLLSLVLGIFGGGLVLILRYHERTLVESLRTTLVDAWGKSGNTKSAADTEHEIPVAQNLELS